MSFLDRLNAQQAEAVTQLGTPLLILAGAGSGKTRVITYRIAYVIGEAGVGAENILAVTFTNKAASEMKERVQQLLAGAGLAGSPWVSTFHSICVRMLRRDGPEAGIQRDFTIYDDDTQNALVKAVLKELGLDEKVFAPRAMLSRISHAKNHGITPQAIYKEAGDERAEKLAVVFERYQAGLKKNNALDFDDLLIETVRLLRDAPAAARKYNERFHHLLVDEYQDTNRIQYEFIRLLTRVHQDVCVVGDEDQSIYSWRGADIRNILEFERDFPRARVIRLEQNYRSTKNILAAAGAVVANNEARKGKTLWTTRESGPEIGFYEAADGEQEALFIADTISKYRRANPEKRAAVLYRANSQSRLVEEALRRYGLKYHVVGGFSFYERAEIKDLIAYLKAACNPDDSIGLLRIVNTPPRGIGKTTLDQIEALALENNLSVWAAIAFAVEQGALPRRALEALAAFRRLIEDLKDLAAGGAPINELLKFVLERTRYKAALEDEGTPEGSSRLENIQELMNAATDAVQRGETLAEFLDHAALVSEADQVDERALISLLTLHSSKGLEFSLVLLAGMEEGTFPHSRSMNSVVALEEERRLCYVGMTRAQDRLVLTRARERRHFGNEMPDRTALSRFVKEIPEELIEDLSGSRRRSGESGGAYQGPVYNSVEAVNAFLGRRAEVMARPRVSTPDIPDEAVATSLQLGMRVRHPKYGIGFVQRREGSGEDAKLTIRFTDYGLRKVVEKYARLEKA